MHGETIKKIKIFSNINFHKNPSSESRALPWGQTDRHGEPNSGLLQFCTDA